jgi:hypothetical protein
MGAATALTLVVLHGAAALADDSTPPVATPVGTLLAGGTGDGTGLTVGFAGEGPAAELPAISVAVEPVPGAPAPAGTLDRVVWSLLPSTLSLPAALVPAAGAPPVSPIQPPAVPAPRRPAAVPPSLTGCALAALSLGPDCAAPVAPLDPVGFALGQAGVPFAASAIAPAPALPAPALPAPAVASRPPLPGSTLASTGTPVVAAFAGLVLLAVGGLLTWARSRLVA